MKILKYDLDCKKEWDLFVDSSKNTHFFFKRDYMEYHCNRFVDFSLLIYDDKNKLIALFPANKQDNVLYSHQGLTFGGFIVDDKMTTETMLNIFEELHKFLSKFHFDKIIYKCIPYIYHTKPAEEDRYALFRNEAKLIRRDISSVINLTTQIRYSKGRKWTINKAKKENMDIIETKEYEVFWNLLTGVLESQHQSKPVHSIDEIKLLAEKFPLNIKLFLILRANEVLAGAIIYENTETVHTQYLANSTLGREIGALDLLLDYLIKEKYNNKKYFDFGISNENQGKILNQGLIAQKEGFGARAMAHDFYEINVK
ncbi:GNAT family N-acetyltransferase [Acinetobacter bereziniae]|uniref:GNAT family N-acetyltransferase n=1 Tax=Acinetobacter bereziniae TaxID=106648 RepID=UPI0039C3A19D